MTDVMTGLQDWRLRAELDQAVGDGGGAGLGRALEQENIKASMLDEFADGLKAEEAATIRTERAVMLSPL